MASISTTDIIVAVGVLGTVLVALVYAIYRLRRQRERLKRDIADGAIPTEDRAFNQLAFSRSEATVLQREGFDVRVPSSMIQDAQRALDRKDFATSLKLSRAAHDALVRLRTAGPNAVLPTDSSSDQGSESGGRSLRSSTRGSTAPGSVAIAGAAAASAEAGPAPTRPPPNRTEAHFQLNLLAGELETLRTKRPNDPRLAGGDRLFQSAQTAFQGGEFTDALRLALRGRRTIGTQVESLPPPGKSAQAAAATSPVQARCSQCGAPSSSTDQFCRACGASVKVGSCPRCANPLRDGDRFCGVCGAPTLT